MTDTSLKDLGEKGTIDKLEGTSKPLLELEERKCPCSNIHATTRTRPDFS